MSENQNWYAVYTRPRWEKKVADLLGRKKIENYCPLNQVVRQWSDRKKIVEEPLLKSYLFVYISAKEHAEVSMTYGFTRFIYFSGRIASIPDKQLEDLRLLLANSTDLELIEHNISLGEKVLIKAGPFKGIMAELVSLKSKKSLVLRLEQIGYAINIRTSMEFIEPLK